MGITVIQAGSIESVVVRVTDEIDGITVLPPGTTYSLFDSDGEPVTGIQDLVATIDGMDALCLIDTTLVATGGDFELYVYLTVGAESPVLGPHKIRVNV